jgi:DNA repair exonuclease SbcCD ATPase subunit
MATAVEDRGAYGGWPLSERIALPPFPSIDGPAHREDRDYVPTPIGKKNEDEDQRVPLWLRGSEVASSTLNPWAEPYVPAEEKLRKRVAELETQNEKLSAQLDEARFSLVAQTELLHKSNTRTAQAEEYIATQREERCELQARNAELKDQLFECKERNAEVERQLFACKARSAELELALQMAMVTANRWYLQARSQHASCA